MKITLTTAEIRSSFSLSHSIAKTMQSLGVGISEDSLKPFEKIEATMDLAAKKDDSAISVKELNKKCFEDVEFPSTISMAFNDQYELVINVDESVIVGINKAYEDEVGTFSALAMTAYGMFRTLKAMGERIEKKITAIIK